MPKTAKKIQVSEFQYIELSPLEVKILEEVKKSKKDIREGRYEDARTFFKRFEEEHNIK